jgi:hypothetical protein
MRLIQHAMQMHPWLAEGELDQATIGLLSANQDGWISTPTATLLRTPGSSPGQRLAFDVQTPADLLPFTLIASGNGWRRELEIPKHGTYHMALPDPPGAPEIIEVRMDGKDFAPDPSVLGVRILFPEAK